MISSRPWIIEPEVKHTTAPKRKTVSSTTTTASPQRETTREVTEWKTYLQPEAIAATPVGDAAKELELPFGGGVTWVEEEGEEMQVKGSAVVEEEKEDPESHSIFEDIFGLDK